MRRAAHDNHSYTHSPRPFGGTFTLDALWRRLGIDTVLKGLDTGPGSTPRRGRPRATEVTERVL